MGDVQQPLKLDGGRSMGRKGWVGRGTRRGGETWGERVDVEKKSYVRTENDEMDELTRAETCFEETLHATYMRRLRSTAD